MSAVCVRQRTEDSIDWYVEISGSGPLCLLLHGTGASSHSWARLTPLLAAHYTVMSVDLPGHARTVTPAGTDLSLPGMAAALHRLLIREQRSPNLIVGHSAGAAIMIELCLTHQCPASQLVSINGALLPLSGIAGWVFSPLAKLSANASWLPRLFAYRANDPRQVRRLLESTGSVIDPVSLACYERLFQDPRHVAGVLSMMANWKLEHLAPRLSQLHQPLHLIATTGDKTIPLRDAYRVHSLISGSTLDVVEGYGHLVHEENPQRIAELIGEVSI
jgi:magnesium chelatase accessory protein